MKFVHVTLSVKDLEASMKFYQEIVGLEVTRKFTSGSGSEIVFLSSGSSGDTEVELIASRGDDSGESGKGISLGFESTLPMDEMIALLKEKGYEPDGSTSSPNPNTRFFFVRDPDGYRIQFMNH